MQQNKIQIFFVLIGIQLFLSININAAKQNYSLQQIANIALQTEENYLSTKQRFLATKLSVPIEQANFMPTIGLNIEKKYEKDFLSSFIGTKNSFAFSAGLQQKLFDYASWNSIKQAKSSVKENEQLLFSAKQQLLIAVSQAYFNLLIAQDRVKLVNKELFAIRSQLNQVKNLIAVNIAKNTDYLETQSRYDEIKALRIDYINQLHSAEDKFILFLKKPLFANNVGNINCNSYNFNKIHQNISTHAIDFSQNRDLKQKFLAIKTSKLAFDIARYQSLPTINIQINYQQNDTIIRKFWQVSLQFDLPLFSGGKIEHQAYLANYKHKQAIEEYKFSYRQTQSNVFNKRNDIFSSWRRLIALRQNVISAQQSLRSTKDSFNNGLRTNIDVLEQIANLYNEKLNLASACYDYLLNILLYKQAIGTLNIDDLTF